MNGNPSDNRLTPDIERLLVLADTHAPSFCYYEVPDAFRRDRAKCMAKDQILACLAYARVRGNGVTFLYGADTEPDWLAAHLAEGNSTRIVPLGALRRATGQAFPVLVDAPDYQELAKGRQFDLSGVAVVILRAPRSGLDALADVCSTLLDHAQRINIVLCGLDSYSDTEYGVYEQQLQALIPAVAQHFLNGYPVEVSTLTDLLFIDSPRECGAGVTHLTCAPNGRLYVCPGFYYADEDMHVARLGEDITPRRLRLFLRECAPVCACCDAYACKRCVYLNARTTLEANIPSEQQCRISHIERACSAQLRELLVSTGYPHLLAPLAPISYADPLERLCAHRTIETTDEHQ